MENLDLILAIITAITSSGVTSIIMYLIQRRDKLKDEAKEQESWQTKMIIGLGHDKILHLTDKYVKRGFITLKEKRNLQYLWEPYYGLGGNGDCKIGYDACQKLQVISDEKAEELDISIKKKEMGL